SGPTKEMGDAGYQGSSEVALRPFVGKQRFHFAPNTDGCRVLVEFDISLAHDCSGPDVPLELHPMREADRERALFQASRGGDELAVDSETAFAIQCLAGLQVTLGDCGDVASPV